MDVNLNSTNNYAIVISDDDNNSEGRGESVAESVLEIESQPVDCGLEMFQGVAENENLGKEAPHTSMIVWETESDQGYQGESEDEDEDEDEDMGTDYDHQNGNQSEESEHDYWHDNDLGYVPEVNSVNPQNYPFPDMNYYAQATSSYLDSQKQLLRYQTDELEQRRQEKGPERSLRKLRLSTTIPTEVMVTIVEQVQKYTTELRPVDWHRVEQKVSEETGHRVSAQESERAFEFLVQEFSAKPTPPMRRPYSKGSTTFLAKLRLLETCPRLLCPKMVSTQFMPLKNYRCATTFNFASGSVVDFALKMNRSGIKLGIANIATKDEYNRPGNLLLADLDRGTVKNMHGHFLQGANHIEPTGPGLHATINDIKLSYSEQFFISGSMDERTMVWNADTGERVNIIEENSGSINQIAVMTDSVHDLDLFATCSSYGSVCVYSLDENGLVKASTKHLKKPATTSRMASCISLGREYFWDCIAVGLEGITDGVGGNDHKGQASRVASDILTERGLRSIEFYDVNREIKVAHGSLGFERACFNTVTSSVSCLAFSSTGRFLVCGTSGRTYGPTGKDPELGDGLVRLYEVKNAKCIQAFQSRHKDVNIVDLSPCENYVISCSSANEIAVFDRRFVSPNHQQPLHRLRHPQTTSESLLGHGGISSALWYSSPSQRGAFKDSGCMLVTSGADGAIKSWDLRRATEDALRCTLDLGIGPLARATASPGFEYLIAGSEQGAVSVLTMDDTMISWYEEKEMMLLA
ncbi:hypothetical protein BGZ83_007468 [Gryganskiella cystojenkinii]|nr:hypothetical protein BGZ83_007468 [Gryganskiella cystojenkinii]